MPQYRVYALVDPTNNTYRYIGYTKDLRTRTLQHLSFSFPQTALWISKLHAKGLKPTVVILEETDNYSIAKQSRRQWIKKCRVEGCDLLNRY